MISLGDAEASAAFTRKRTASSSRPAAGKAVSATDGDLD